MAAIVNARDTRLQAASSRLVSVTLPDNIVVPAVKSIRLSAPSLLFHVGTTGVGTPASITLTASLRHVAGTISWTITGGALTGTGFTRTLAYSAMTADTAIISASVTEAGVTYTDTVTIVNVRDGQNGANGTNGAAGQRGTVQLARATAGSTWSNADAAAAITANGSGSPIAGDVVTLYNLTTTYSEARVYAGGTWSPLSAYLSGSLLVDGTVVANKINGRDLRVMSGGYTAWASPPAGQTGFYIGPEGMAFGNANDGSYITIEPSGRIYAPGLFIENGNATFSGELNAARGTFSGSMTSDAVNAVDTINLAGNAVTVPISAETSPLPANTGYPVSNSMTTRITLGSITTSATGRGTVVIWLSAYDAPVLATANLTANGASSITGTFAIRLLRNGTVVTEILRTLTGQNTVSVSMGGGTAVDSPGAGVAASYELEIFTQVSNSGTGRNIHSAAAIRCIFMECKK